MKHYPLVIPAMGTSYDAQDFEVDPTLQPGERAARLELTRLRALISHICQLLPAKHTGLATALEWVDEVGSALDEVEAAIDNEELFAGNARAGEDESYDDLEQVLDNYDGDADFDSDNDELSDFATAMVDYWLYDVLRTQCFDFLSLLNGSVPAFGLIESYEHLGRIRYLR